MVTPGMPELILIIFFAGLAIIGYLMHKSSTVIKILILGAILLGTAVFASNSKEFLDIVSILVFLFGAAYLVVKIVSGFFCLGREKRIKEIEKREPEEVFTLPKGYEPISIKNNYDFSMELIEYYHIVKESYRYPLKDLIGYLMTTNPYKGIKYAKKDNRYYYFVFFASPGETWEKLCGVSGVFRIDADSYKALDFEVMMRN